MIPWKIAKHAPHHLRILLGHPYSPGVGGGGQLVRAYRERAWKNFSPFLLVTWGVVLAKVIGL